VTTKICKVGPDGVLPPKLKAELPIAQALPEMILGVSRIAAQLIAPQFIAPARLTSDPSAVRLVGMVSFVSELLVP